jgi:hypothetical protein
MQELPGRKGIVKVGQFHFLYKIWGILAATTEGIHKRKSIQEHICFVRLVFPVFMK